MKLASLKRGRDGALVVVSDDLAWYADAGHIVPTLQAALDDWERHAPSLAALATDVRSQAIPLARFHEHDAASPLPRADRWIDGSAHADRDDPPADRGGADGFLAPRDPIPLADAGRDRDFGAEVVAVTGEVAQGASREEALAAIRLVGLCNGVSLRGLIPGDPAGGPGWVRWSAFSPVFVTPEALGGWWREGRLHRRLCVDLNGRAFGRVEAGEGMTVDFGTLVARAARTGALGAGTIVGSGTVSDRAADDGPGRPVAEGGAGYSSLAELRSFETIRAGAAVTPFLAAGDTVRIWAEDDRHHPIFGAIEQVVAG